MIGYSNVEIQNMIRKEMYSIEEVLSKIVPAHIKKNESKVNFDGDAMKMNSHRYHNFKQSGICCVECGIEGKYFVKEKFLKDKSFHFNLYAIDENGREVLMTKDHIMPKSKGGPNVLENYQTMCTYCNGEKGNKMPEEVAVSA